MLPIGAASGVHLKQTKKYFRVGVERPRDDHMLYRGQWLSVYAVVDLGIGDLQGVNVFPL